jgi:methylmalonyl-CoA mutase N-terminal domain/subunit
MDEALGLPTEHAARIALRTQQVIACESGVADTADPLGGSYAVEELTNEIERIASDYINKIDQMGGMLSAIESGYVQREIERAAYEYQRAIESGSQTVVGVNRFSTDEEAPIAVLTIDPGLERQQVERLHEVRASRSQSRVGASLDMIERAARAGENLMPFIIDAVESYATLGEISDRLRAVFGEYKGNLES